MAHTHEFDCRVCGAHLDSRKELDEHTREKHSQKASTERTAGASSQNKETQR